MKKIKKGFVCLVLLTALQLPLAFASDEETAGDYAKGMITKFGRGLVNVVSSPFEIPCSIREEMFDRGAAGFFTGFGKGTVLMLRRILVGVTEVGTFIIPMEPTLPMVCQSR